MQAANDRERNLRNSRSSENGVPRRAAKVDAGAAHGSASVKCDKGHPVRGGPSN